MLTTPSCPTDTLSYSTIYPKTLHLGTAEKAGLQPKPLSKLASGLWSFAHNNPHSPWVRLLLAAISGPLGQLKVFFFNLNPPSLPDSKLLCQQLQVVPEILYPTPPSIIRHYTWVVQSKLACGQYFRVNWPGAFGPLPIKIQTHQSFACRWRLGPVLQSERESFFN